MSLLDELMSQLGDGPTRDIGDRLGVDQGTASKAIAGALPMVLGGLARNAQKSDGAEALLGALGRDHDGSLLDDLGGYLGSDRGAGGEKIVGHVFGGGKGNVEAALGQLSGLGSGKSGQLLAMLAPIVMGALGKQQRAKGFDAGGLAEMLGRESQGAGAGKGDAMSQIGELLDRDGDGDFTDDIAKMGKGLLGGLLGGKR